MYKKIKIFFRFLFLAGVFVLILSCQEKEYRHDELIQIPSKGDSIRVKISYPEKNNHNKIIIWSQPPLRDKFLADSVDNPRHTSMDVILRRALLDSGYINIEYIERKDSVVYAGRRYRVSDRNTKAKDLDNLLSYISGIKNLKNKKRLLIGYSEGADINLKIATQKQSEITGMILLAGSALTGKETVEYQMKTQLFDRMLIVTSHGNQERMDATINRMSSLDSYHTADEYGNGTRQFFEENFVPLDSIIYQYKDHETVYANLDLYLHNRWEKENQDTKDLWEYDFECYYDAFAGSITPQQITLKNSNPAEYLPFVECPVLAVHGTQDERIDCYPNMERMEELLSRRKKNYFQKMILEDYRHNLVKWHEGRYIVEDEVIEQIIDWIHSGNISSPFF
jgi:alpha/beta hydrolase fold.